jgi:hypothetical protein
VVSRRIALKNGRAPDKAIDIVMKAVVAVGNRVYCAERGDDAEVRFRL